MNEFTKAHRLMEEFESKIPDSQIYIVGGAVRNMLMGIPPKDVDFATNITPDVIEQHFDCVDIGQSKDFGIVAILFEGEAFEVATFRTDGESSNSRHPDSVQVGVTIEEDAARRDFTINGLFANRKGCVMDFHNGVRDIHLKVVRAIGDADERINEDALRMIRALRFAAVFDFTIDRDLFHAILANRFLIVNVSQERITSEIIKVAENGGPAFVRFMDLVNDCGLMPIIFPEINEMKNFNHNWIHHPEYATMIDNETREISNLKIASIELGTHHVLCCSTVFDHTFAAMEQLKDDDTVATILSVLFHDVGKIKAAVLRDPELETCGFKGHDFVGAKMFEDIAKRMKIKSSLRDEIIFCIKEHMTMHTVKRKARVAELATHKFFLTLARVTAADDAARGPELSSQEAIDERLQKFWDARDRIGDEADFKAKVGEFIDGRRVMALRGINGGHEVGTVLKKVTGIIVDRDFDITQDEVDALIRRTHA